MIKTLIRDTFVTWSGCGKSMEVQAVMMHNTVSTHVCVK